jgi:hypothetical protein
MSDRRKKHGLQGLMSKVSSRGLTALDQRSAGARALMEWKRELVADLGGEANLTSQRRTLVELAVRHRLFLDEIDQWLMSQSSLVNKRRRSALPILSTRMQLSDALTRLLTTLGLNRQEPPPPSLQEYLASKEAQPGSEPEPNDAQEQE